MQLGAAVDVKDKAGMTVLMHAAQSGSGKTVKALLKKSLPLVRLAPYTTQTPSRRMSGRMASTAGPRPDA